MSGATTSAPETLRALLDRGHERHAAEPRELAAALCARAPALTADAEGAEAITLAEHVALAHPADAQVLDGFLAALPPALAGHEATAPALQRANWALARFKGRAEPDLADALRWRSLQNAVLGAARQGRVDQALAWLLQDEAAAIAHPDPAARRAYAISANNVALDLRLGRRGDAAIDGLMLQAAALSHRAWVAAGTWLQQQRAQYQWALCHAVLGQGEAALAHAGHCLALCSAHGADAAEHFFALEALAHAHRARGDAAAADSQRTAMAGLLERIEDAQMREWCAQALRALDA